MSKGRSILPNELINDIKRKIETEMIISLIITLLSNFTGFLIAGISSFTSSF
jgi:hypothetical protein